MPARASNHSRLNRVISVWSSAEVRTGVGIDGACVELHGVKQRQGRRGGTGQRQTVLAEAPETFGPLDCREAEPSKVVESDGRVGTVQAGLGVEVAQQSVGQGVRQCTKLLLGVLDRRPQRRVTGDHLCPIQPIARPA